jgi:hypothetical protein
LDLCELQPVAIFRDGDKELEKETRVWRTVGGSLPRWSEGIREAFGDNTYCLRPRVLGTDTVSKARINHLSKATAFPFPKCCENTLKKGLTCTPTCERDCREDGTTSVDHTLIGDVAANLGHH